ncbi:twin-arginine translocation signal domain-containing protein [Serratia liquefaciens]
MLSRRDILKVSAVSAAAAGVMAGMIKSASADEHRNIVPPSNFQPAADVKNLYKYVFSHSKKRSLPNGWAR